LDFEIKNGKSVNSEQNHKFTSKLREEWQNILSTVFPAKRPNDTVLQKC